MDVDPAFWRDRTVLVTGHTGFKGSWLALWLQQLGADVIGYSLPPPTSPSLYELARVGSGMRSVEADVREPARLAQVVAECGCDVIFHLAAQSLVRRSFREPRETYEVNVLGTLSVLEAAGASDAVRAAVVVTSDKCYEIGGGEKPFVESDRLGGDDPYSSSKACAELLTAAFCHSFLRDGIPAVATARAGNVIGGGDWAEDRLVPDAMVALLERRPLLIRSPDAVRPWQHVLDPLRGYLVLAQQLVVGRVAGGAWNFGPAQEDARSVSAVVERLGELWGPSESWVRDDAEHPKETAELRLDATKAHDELGWSPRWCLDEALACVVEWYRAYAADADLRATTLEQIERYAGTTAA